MRHVPIRALMFRSFLRLVLPNRIRRSLGRAREWGERRYDPLADRENLNTGGALGGVEDFRRDEEYRRLNPPLSADELAELEALLVSDGGAKDALVVWREEQLLLDGYNRAALCERLGLPFTIRLGSLPDREAAKTWISAASERTTQPDAGRVGLSARQAFPGREGSARANRLRTSETKGKPTI